MNKLKLSIFLYIEKKHRIVFDTYYTQEYIITDEDKEEIKKYNILCNLYPSFRYDLKNKHEELKKLKKTKKLSDDENLLYDLLTKHNVTRYTGTYD